MIKKIYVKITGSDVLYDVRYENGIIREYKNKAPKTVKNFISKSPFTTIKGDEYGKEVNYFIF